MVVGGREGERGDRLREKVSGREAQAFRQAGVSHPVLTSGYAHSKDGCFSIDQLDFAMWPVSKKRGKRDPPGHPVARGLRQRDAFIYVSFLPSPPFQYREKNFFPTAYAAPSAPLQSLPLFFLRHENSSRKMIIRFRQRASCEPNLQNLLFNILREITMFVPWISFFFVIVP